MVTKNREKNAGSSKIKFLVFAVRRLSRKPRSIIISYRVTLKRRDCKDDRKYYYSKIRLSPWPDKKSLNGFINDLAKKEVSRVSES